MAGWTRRSEKGTSQPFGLFRRRRPGSGDDPRAEFELAHDAWNEGRQREALAGRRKIAARDRLPGGDARSSSASSSWTPTSWRWRSSARAPRPSKSPRRALPHYFRGRIYDRMGRLDDALAAHRRAIDLEPENAECHYRFGVTLARNERVGRCRGELSPRHLPSIAATRARTPISVS